MNADVPPFQCLIREQFLNGREGFEEAFVFGISSIKGRALGFHALLKSGAHFRHLPAHAIAFSESAPPRKLKELAMWDCFSSVPVVWKADFLKDHEAFCLIGGQKLPGTYLFTVDWLPDRAETPGFTLIPEQMKCAHVFQLQEGNLCYLPTNRVAWRDGYWIGESPDPKSRGYRVQKEVYQAEGAELNLTGEEWAY